MWPQFPSLRSLRGEWSETIELVRDGTRELARVFANTWGWQIRIEGLPKSITRVEVYGNVTSARELAARTKKLEVIAMPPPSGKITGVK